MSIQLLVFFFLVSCGYNNTEIPGAQVTNEQGGQTSELTYSVVSSQIFQPHCVRCHGGAGGVSLSTYAGVQGALTRVQAAVNSGRMPPSGSIPQTTKNLLNQWIEAGAPETGTGAGTTAGGGNSAGTAGGGTGGCEDDDRLMGAGLVVMVGSGRVFDKEAGLIRNLRRGCDD